MSRKQQLSVCVDSSQRTKSYHWIHGSRDYCGLHFQEKAPAFSPYSLHSGRVWRNLHVCWLRWSCRWNPTGHSCIRYRTFQYGRHDDRCPCRARHAMLSCFQPDTPRWPAELAGQVRMPLLYLLICYTLGDAVKKIQLRFETRSFNFHKKLWLYLYCWTRGKFLQKTFKSLLDFNSFLVLFGVEVGLISNVRMYFFDDAHSIL